MTKQNAAVSIPILLAVKPCNRTFHSSIAILMVFITALPSVFAQGFEHDTSIEETDNYEGTPFKEREEKKNFQGREGRMSDSMFSESGRIGLTYQVHILGEVTRPGTYRIPVSSRLSEAIEKANDILKRGSQRKIELRRGRRTQIIDLLSFRLLGNLDGNPYLLDNDTVYVPLRNKVIRIEGTIKRVGAYELKDEKSLEDVINLAGGFTPGVGNLQTLQVIRFKDGKKSVLNVENKKEAREAFQVEDADIIYSPNILTADRKFDFNVSNLPGDNPLFYPSYIDRVFVLGGVNAPGPYKFSPYYGVNQYLTLAGGTSKLSKRNEIEIISLDGQKSKWTKESMINPGDAIYVPEKRMSPESIVSLVLGITTSILGISTTIFALTR